MELAHHVAELEDQGFTILERVIEDEVVDALLAAKGNAGGSSPPSRPAAFVVTPVVGPEAVTVVDEVAPAVAITAVEDTE